MYRKPEESCSQLQIRSAASLFQSDTDSFLGHAKVTVFVFALSTSLPRWLPLGRQHRFAGPIEYYAQSGTLSIAEGDGSRRACTFIVYTMHLLQASLLIGRLVTCAGFRYL